MGLEEELSQVNQEIDKNYQEMILNRYYPIFERIKNEAKEIMNSYNILEIKLDIHDGLSFKKDGFFHRNSLVLGNTVNDLRKIAKLYQAENEYLQACADYRVISRMSTQEALKDALYDLTKKVKKAVDDKLFENVI